MAQLTHEQYELLERAVMRGQRIVAHRRGSELIIVPSALRMERGREAIIGRHPATGDALTIFLDDLDAIEVIR